MHKIINLIEENKITLEKAFDMVENKPYFIDLYIYRNNITSSIFLSYFDQLSNHSKCLLIPLYLQTFPTSDIFLNKELEIMIIKKYFLVNNTPIELHMNSTSIEGFVNNTPLIIYNLPSYNLSLNFLLNNFTYKSDLKDRFILTNLILIFKTFKIKPLYINNSTSTNNKTPLVPNNICKYCNNTLTVEETLHLSDTVNKHMSNINIPCYERGVIIMSLIIQDIDIKGLKEYKYFSNLLNDYWDVVYTDTCKYCNSDKNIDVKGVSDYNTEESVNDKSVEEGFSDKNIDVKGVSDYNIEESVNYKSVEEGFSDKNIDVKGVSDYNIEESVNDKSVEEGFSDKTSNNYNSTPLLVNLSVSKEIRPSYMLQAINTLKKKYCELTVKTIPNLLTSSTSYIPLLFNTLIQYLTDKNTSTINIPVIELLTLLHVKYLKIVYLLSLEQLFSNNTSLTDKLIFLQIFFTLVERVDIFMVKEIYKYFIYKSKGGLYNDTIKETVCVFLRKCKDRIHSIGC